MTPVEYTLQAEDIASARLLALGVRPRVEFSLFAAVLIGLSALSVTNLSFGSLPLLIGLTACLGAFRLTQINKVRQAAAGAFNRPTPSSNGFRGASSRRSRRTSVSCCSSKKAAPFTRFRSAHSPTR